MKRLALLILLIPLLALAACGGTTATPAVNDAPAITGTLAADDADQPETNADAETADNQTADVAPAGDATNDGQTNDAALGDPLLVRDRDHRRGPDGAAVTVIEYADFQCPGCASFAPLLTDLTNRFPDDVQVVYRHFPLTSIHPLATKAAEASEAAAAQDKFWEFNEALFAQQSDWARLSEDEAVTFFVDLAGTLGLDTAQFADELASGMYTDYVNQLEQEAIALGLPGTPSAIVNGGIVPGESLPRDLAVWEEFVTGEKAMQDLAARQYKAAPPMTIDTTARYLAHVEMASGDTFTIELLPQSAPQTVNSFIFLAREGWFDGVTFHRVLPGFVAQTGDPSGTGRGGPGYMLPNEIDPTLSHDQAGMVAMANAGPNTNGSQWYITYGDVSQLDGSYTIFGRVTENMNIVEAITPRDPSRQPNAPAGDTITRITIEEIK
jgi:cyclophilin family peptidyl-prolyl cis-trans isomerase/protein-disulfide isomerase